MFDVYETLGFLREVFFILIFVLQNSSARCANVRILRRVAIFPCSGEFIYIVREIKEETFLPGDNEYIHK